MKRYSAICAAALITLSMAGTCFAGEWKDTDNGKMYVDNGKAVTGMEEIDGETYYFNSKGIMKTGWLKTKSGKKYYFGSDGVMKRVGSNPSPANIISARTALLLQALTR